LKKWRKGRDRRKRGFVWKPSNRCGRNRRVLLSAFSVQYELTWLEKEGGSTAKSCFAGATRKQGGEQSKRDFERNKRWNALDLSNCKWNAGRTKSVSESSVRNENNEKVRIGSAGVKRLRKSITKCSVSWKRKQSANEQRSCGRKRRPEKRLSRWSVRDNACSMNWLRRSARGRRPNASASRLSRRRGSWNARGGSGRRKKQRKHAGGSGQSGRLPSSSSV